MRESKSAPRKKLRCPVCKESALVPILYGPLPDSLTVKLRQEVRHFRERDRRRFDFENLIGDSEPIRGALALMKKVAASPATTILFQGESGTGKDLFATAIHFYSSRSDRPFLAVNCAALPENLVESELFGYERGAYFVDEYNARFAKNITGFTPEAERVLSLYHWPGNVRELKNLIERALILVEGSQIGVDALPVDVAEPPSRGPDHALPDIALPDKGTSLEKVEEELIRQALSRTRGNQTRAAKLLNISRDALRYKMKKFELQQEGR